MITVGKEPNIAEAAREQMARVPLAGVASTRTEGAGMRRSRAASRSLGLRSVKEWRAFCRAKSGNERMLPRDIPAAPLQVYAKDGWAGYIDWLGIEDLHDSRRFPYRSYEDACAFVCTLGIRSMSEWNRYCRGELDGQNPRLLDIPATPETVYRGRGWMSWGRFLGTNTVASAN